MNIQLNKKLIYKWLPEIFLLILGLFWTFWKIKTLPGEMFGDIIAGVRMTEGIIDGRMPFYFDASNGPLFFYAYVTPVVLFLGRIDYFALKVASAIAAILMATGTYLMIRELLGREVALVSVFTMVVSKYYLSLGRIGNMNIAMGASVAWIYYFFYRFIVRKDYKSILFMFILLGFGMYNYMAFHVVLPTLLLIYTYYVIKNPRDYLLRCWKWIVVSLVVFFIICIPYSKITTLKRLFKNSDGLGEKWVTKNSTHPVQDVVDKLRYTIPANFGSLHLQGDPIFRANPPGQPMLDRFSGLFFLAGLAYLLIFKKYRKNIVLLVVPMLGHFLPAIMVLNFREQSPSFTRIIGASPFIFALIGFGIIMFVRFLKKPILQILFLITILVSISLLNYKMYFVDYPRTLPDHNTDFGSIIASKIDKNPTIPQIFTYGCCWGEAGQPNPETIQFALKYQRPLTVIPVDLYKIKDEIFNCDYYKNKSNFVIIAQPNWKGIQEGVSRCFSQGEGEILKENGFDVAFYYFHP